MAKEKNQTSPVEAPEAQAIVASTNRRYIGPSYDEGIQLPGDRQIWRPADMNAEQIDAFLAQFPDRADWFEAA